MIEMVVKALQALKLENSLSIQFPRKRVEELDGNGGIPS
jgi:hypothetical protein